MTLKRLTPLVLFILTVFSPLASKAVIYVDTLATSGNMNGTSWSDAYLSIEDGLKNAQKGDSVWIMKGRYKPSGNGTSSLFRLVNGVHVFGGFDGTEKTIMDRDLSKNVTYLDGNINDPTKANDNCRITVFAYQLSTETILDGFTIMNGYAYVVGNSSLNIGGGGLKVTDSKVLVRNCIFEDNYTYMRGGAIHSNQSSSLYLEDCTFRNNFTGNNIQSLGGAIFANSGLLKMTDCVFIGNSGQRGGAVSTYSASILIDRCKFYGNEAVDDYGGAIDVGSESSSYIYNSLFVGNYAESSGAAIYMQNVINEDFHRYVNCTFTANYNKSTSGITVHTGNRSTVRNCILWNNTDKTEIFYLLPTFEPTVENCVIDGGVNFGKNNYNVDPGFLKPPGSLTAPFNADTFDLNVADTSICVDNGNNAFVISLYPNDLNDSTRIRSISVDIGAYESPYERFQISVGSSDTIAGSAFGDSIYHKDSTASVHYVLNSSCYQFLHWKENDSIVSTDSVYQFRVSANRTLTAHFKQNSYKVTLSSADTTMGTVSGGGNFPCDPDTMMAFHAIPKDCYELVRWTQGGIEVSTDPALMVAVTSDAQYVAHFQHRTHTLTVETSPVGAGAVTGGGTYDCDSAYTVTATSDNCHSFKHWEINSQVVSTDTSYTATIDSNTTIKAVFNTTKYTVALSRNDAFGGTISGSGFYNCGESIPITATPASGYKFIAWKENGSVVSSKPDTTLVMSRDIDLTAFFEKTTGIRNFVDLNNVISVYPNPTSNVLSVSINNGESINDVSITSITGTVIYQKSDLSNSSIEIKSSGFEPGTYIVRITTNTGIGYRQITVLNQ